MCLVQAEAMMKPRDELYYDASMKSQEAFRLCLVGELDYAQGILHDTRTRLKGLSGDLPIVGYGGDAGDEGDFEDAHDRHFATRSLQEAQAWGWLELASGVFQLMRGWPGGSLVHFLRAWRIWRPWTIGVDGTVKEEAIRERVRVSLWLGEGWSRIMSERAEHAANAVLRAALTELARIEAKDLLAETISQQLVLPAAPRGSPAYNEAGMRGPYVMQLARVGRLGTGYITLLDLVDTIPTMPAITRIAPTIRTI